MILPRSVLAGLLVTGALNLAVPAGAQVPSNLDAPAPFPLSAPTARLGATVPVASHASSTLRGFGLSAGDLTFTGESAARDIAFFVTSDETARPGRLVISLGSAVSILPETSNFQVVVNGAPVASTRLGLNDETRLDIPLTAGLLQPGYNAVRMVVEQHHRVDCSIQGTYELWTRIDPARSGIDFAMPAARLSGLGELPALNRTDGRPLTVRGIVRPGDAAAQIENLMTAIQAVVLMGRFEGAAIEFATSPGTGPGLDVVVGTPAELGAGAAMGEESTSVPNVHVQSLGERARLSVTGNTTLDVASALGLLSAEAERMRPVGAAAGLQALDGNGGFRMAGTESVSLDQLGFVSPEFNGRLYRKEVSFSLPADFYAANYANASLSLDAAYAANLGPQARLVVRANDKEVSSLPLSSSRAGRIENQALRISLDALKPGRNTLSFEANVANATDAVCDPAAMLNPPARLGIFDTSTIDLPYLARIGHVPDIAAFAGGGLHRSGDDAKVALLAPGLDPAALGAAASVVARMALAAGRVQGVDVLSTLPADGPRVLVAAGTYATLPPALTSQVRFDPAVLVEAQPDGGLMSLAANAATAPSNPFAAFTGDTDIKARLTEFAAPVVRPFLDAFGSSSATFDDRSGSALVRPRPDTLISIVQGIAETDEPGTWTVLAAPDAPSLAKGALDLVQPGIWSRLGGGATLVSQTGELTLVQPESERLFQTQPVTLRNMRYVVAGWFSRHSENYLFAMLGLGLVLAVSTRFFVRSLGTKQR